MHTKYLWTNNQNLNREDFESQSYSLVTEHNALITQVKHGLGARELKVMDFVISKIQPNDDHFNVINTSMYELITVLGLKKSGKTYSQLTQAIESLHAKRIMIYNEEELSSWLEVVNLSENGQIQLKINKQLEPFLLHLKDNKNYVQYLLKDTVHLKSKYSILLYKLMRECDKSPGSKIAILQGTPDKFKDWLGAPESYTCGRLKDNILKPAVEEINLKIDDMNLEILQARRGRKVVQVEIHNNFVVNSSK